MRRRRGEVGVRRRVMKERRGVRRECVCVCVCVCVCGGAADVYMHVW